MVHSPQPREQPQSTAVYAGLSQLAELEPVALCMYTHVITWLESTPGIPAVPLRPTTRSEKMHRQFVRSRYTVKIAQTVAALMHDQCYANVAIMAGQ